MTDYSSSVWTSAFARALEDRAVRGDEEWFDRNPDRDYYIRPRVTGEVGPNDDLFDDTEFTLVRRHPDGTYSRQPSPSHDCVSVTS